jgi:peptidoglycan/xylan/chitin deacetylase (PgdA/CDA1 family)
VTLRALATVATVAALALAPAGSAATSTRGDAARRATPVPILMYHAIGNAPSNAPYPELYVSRSSFAAEIAWLARNGYHAVTLRRAYDSWTRNAQLPARPVVLSFDDGYRGDVSVALPLLRRHRWPGVLNFHIGNLIPAKVRRLIAAGWELDSHTFTHTDLTSLDAAQLRHDVRDSRTWLRGVFHVPVDFFCYPSGRYDATVVAAVRAAGYLGATTTNYGLASPSDGLYTLDRVRVNGSDGAEGLASKLRALGSA